jgi:hypothetical protein
MTEHDAKAFSELLTGVMEVYGRVPTAVSSKVWWAALNRYEFQVVSKAFSDHVTNTESGQFFPKPADIIKAIEGNAQDAATLAWAKLQQAVSSVGQYYSVAFDDPLIHLVLQDMGGWPSFCKIEEKDLPFAQKRFENAHRAYYSKRNEFAEYPKYLPGVCEAANAANGFPVDPPRLVGNEEAATRVLERGVSANRFAVSKAGPVRAALPPSVSSRGKHQP